MGEHRGAYAPDSGRLSVEFRVEGFGVLVEVLRVFKGISLVEGPNMLVTFSVQGAAG